MRSLLERLRKIFADNLTYWLESGGRKQSWLAEKLGVSTTIVSGWKKGERFPRLDHLEGLAQIIGVHPGILLVENGLEDPQEAMEKILSTRR